MLKSQTTKGWNTLFSTSMELAVQGLVKFSLIWVLKTKLPKNYLMMSLSSSEMKSPSTSSRVTWGDLTLWQLRDWRRYNATEGWGTFRVCLAADNEPRTTAGLWRRVKKFRLLARRSPLVPSSFTGLPLFSSRSLLLGAIWPFSFSVCSYAKCIPCNCL